MYDDFGDRSSFVGLHIECVTCPVHASFFVFRHNAVCSTQGPLFVLDPQDLSPVDIPSRNTSLALTPTKFVLLLSRLWNSGAAIKSVVMICTVGSGEGPTV